jgi:phage shock protein PspC (stress-responsive transcriptional regulator)
MLAGVCAGLADYLGVDVTLIRVIVAVLSVFGGTGLIAYVIAWLLMPEEGAERSEAARFVERFQNRR